MLTASWPSPALEMPRTIFSSARVHCAEPLGSGGVGAAAGADVAVTETVVDGLLVGVDDIVVSGPVVSAEGLPVAAALDPEQPAVRANAAATTAYAQQRALTVIPHSYPSELGQTLREAARTRRARIDQLASIERQDI